MRFEVAAIGRAQLQSFPDWQLRRHALAAGYDEGLEEIDGLGLPHRPRPVDGVHAWHLYPVRVGHGLRDQVRAELAAREISTSVHFIPVHHLRWFQQTCVMPHGGLSGADRLFDQLLSLPLYPRLTYDQVDATCEAVADVFRTARRGVSCPSH